MPSKSFLLEYCYENWAKWTECAKEEALRLHKSVWNSKTNQSSDQLDTLLNVELLAARLSQVCHDKSMKRFNGVFRPKSTSLQRK